MHKRPRRGRGRGKAVGGGDRTAPGNRGRVDQTGRGLGRQASSPSPRDVASGSRTFGTTTLQGTVQVDLGRRTARQAGYSLVDRTRMLCAHYLSFPCLSSLMQAVGSPSTYVVRHVL